MFDTDAQNRINRCCSNAALGYMRAAGAAYAAAAEQVFDFWSQSLEAMLPEEPAPAKKSWYVEPDQFKRSGRIPSNQRTGSWACMMPWAGATIAGPFPQFGQPSNIWDWFETWVSLANPQTAVAWPMACGMMAIGVPQSVAWPAAQANAAAMDAFNTAAKSVEEAVVSYRSDGGHAVARVVTAR